MTLPVALCHSSPVRLTLGTTCLPSRPVHNGGIPGVSLAGGTEENIQALPSVVSYSPLAVMKYPRKSTFRKEGFLLPHSLRIPFTMTGRRSSEAWGSSSHCHMAATVRKLWRQAGAHLAFSFYSGRDPSSLKITRIEDGSSHVK